MATLPWDRSSIISADMFGELGDDPALRRARQVEAERLQAEAEYEARAAQPRAWETPQSISSEVFAPLSSAFGIDQLGMRGRQAVPASRQPEIIHAGSGSSILRRDPFTGAVEEVWRDERPVKAASYKVPAAADVLGRPTETINLTEDEIRKGVESKTLPAQALESEIVKFVMSKPAATATPIAMPAATPQRESWGFIDAGDSSYGNAFDSGLGRRSPFDEGFNSVRREPAAPVSNKPSGGITVLKVTRRK